jgi:hypothetical protein
LNENNSNEWSYLVNYITAPNIGKRYGQLPKTVEISVNCNLLEKERAIVGAAHFGHAPHTEDYLNGKYRSSPPDNSNNPTDMHKSLVVYTDEKKVSLYTGGSNIDIPNTYPNNPPVTTPVPPSAQPQSQPSFSQQNLT